MYRRRSQCCPGYFESGDLCVREYPLFNSFVLSDGIQVMSAGTFCEKGGSIRIDCHSGWPAAVGRASVALLSGLILTNSQSHHGTTTPVNMPPPSM